MRKTLSQILIASLLVIFISCENKINDFGRDMLIGVDTLTVIYDIDIDASTISVDEVGTSDFPIGLLGSYTDPIWGFTKAEFITQLVPSRSDVKLIDEVLRVDSLCLIIKYQAVYGSKSSPLEISVYNVNTSFSNDSVSSINLSNYCDNQILNEGGDPVLFTPNDSVLKIFLDISFAVNNLLINPAAFNSSHSELFSSTNGLYLSCKDVLNKEGSIVHFNLNETSFKLRLYYNGNQTYDFVANDKCSRVKSFKHDLGHSSISSLLNDSTPSPDSLAYIQAMGGTNVLVRLNNTLPWKNLTILHADLIVPIIENVEYPAPSILMLMTHDTKYTKSITTVDPLYMGKYTNGATLINGNYSFNITESIKKIALGIEPEEFIILPAYSDKNGNRFYNSNIANRVVISNSKNKHIKLKIIYSNFKE